MRFRTLEEIRRHLSCQRTSGLSIAAYCKRDGVAPNTFFNWKKRHRDSTDDFHRSNAGPVSFLQLPTQSAENQKFDLTLPNGSRLAMPLPCDPAFLRQTIRMLSGLRPR